MKNGHFSPGKSRGAPLKENNGKRDSPPASLARSRQLSASAAFRASASSFRLQTVNSGNRSEIILASSLLGGGIPLRGVRQRGHWDRMSRDLWRHPWQKLCPQEVETASNRSFKQIAHSYSGGTSGSSSSSRSGEGLTCESLICGSSLARAFHKTFFRRLLSSQYRRYPKIQGPAIQGKHPYVCMPPQTSTVSVCNHNRCSA
mmetsp:Transcript_13684/g.27221  ORF Transcript_13684/g.27221 Transcript_13684/m.27221 type:complete len:202 (-) Transcript_13684:80-685(-)